MKWPVALFAFPLSVGFTMVMASACGTPGLGIDTGKTFGAGGSTSSGHGGMGGVVATGGAGGNNGGSTATGINLGDSGLPDATYGVCVPKTCAELGATCGPQGDGCGNEIQCGNCKAPQTCGGGGTPNQCGTPPCTPKTCADWNANCGPVSDGCGNVIQCGTCNAPTSCGGGGMPSQCGGNTGCVPTTCAAKGVNCGPIGDGCGGLLQCGSCAAPQTCGGGGKPGVCGNGSSDASVSCTPKTCVELGINCGPAGDGCGGQLDCGTCSAPQTCGGGGTPGKCGGNSGCVPKTCVELGFNCGPAGDGCGGVLQCGTCAAPQTCGGGGTAGVCGGANACVPKTCAQLGLNCGPAGDGCGGLLQCGSCNAPAICGGGTTGQPGQPGVCGPTGAPPTCTNLCLKQVTCPGKNVTTTVSGTVFAPNGVDPIYNALVYVPNAAVAPFAPGVSCDQCSNGVSGSPLVSTTTAPDGTFQLQNVPVGNNIPIVIQLGRWRRQLVIPTVTQCVDNAPTAPFFRLPKNQGEGDIPLVAMVTGSADPLECILRQIGLDDAEFTNPTASGGTGRIQFYVSNGANSSTGNAPSVTKLFASQTAINAYDMVILSCDGTPSTTTNDWTATNQGLLNAYAAAGGRVFATHYSYVWLDNASTNFQGTATWNVGQTDPADPLTGFIDFTNPKGQAFAQWTQVVGAAGTPPVYGQVSPLHQTRRDFSAVNAAEAQRWLYWKSGTTTQVPLHYTFNTPVGAMPANQCGRVLYSDFHVDTLTGAGDFPTECSPLGTPLSPQGHLLEFMLFDLASCVTPVTPPPPPTCTPLTCTQQGFNCGPAGDGCGGQIDCGACTAPQTCGGGGKPGVCGGMPCAPTTCAAQGIQCGPASDGCGNLIQCGNCPNGTTCGGGGQPGKCGKPSCSPITCAAQGIQCGPAGDGCGGVLQCGSCPPGETCGGGGPGKCGGPDAGICTPLTCAAQNIQCGPAGDGCGGQLDCGPCPAGETCGGGGMPGVCGAPMCTQTTCADLGLECGPAGDGCGGVIQCGTCPPNETCGGCGTPGKCGSCCVPTTCQKLGFTCGPAGDGCGGLLDCGSCTAPDTCGGGGTPGQCGHQMTN